MNDVASRIMPKSGVALLKRERSRTLYFVAASVLATLIPLIFFAGFWIRAELGKSQRDLEAMLGARAVGLSQKIDSTVQDELHALHVVSVLPNLGADAAFRIEAEKVVEALPEWHFIAVIDPADRNIILHTLNPAPAPIGVVPDAPRFRELLETRRPWIQSVDAQGSVLQDQRGLLLYLPAIRDGIVRHVVVAGLRPNRLQSMVNADANERVLTVLLDDKMRIMARSRGAESFVGRDASAEFKGLVGTKDSGIFDSRTLDGQAVATAFQRSPLTGWVAVTSIDRSEFDSASRRSVWATIVAGALSLTLAGILAVFLFHNVMEQRVSNERLAATRALGELDARLLATTQEALSGQRKSASEREVLLREIYHRVKNNLQIVQSLLRLGSRDLTRDQREPFENAVRRIGAMARVHTLLYNSADLASIDFKEYLVELVREASDAFHADERGITTTLDVSPMRVPLDTAVPLAFIAVEILTNSYRHAFPPGHRGTISISAHREKEWGRLVISDDGVGVPEGGTAGKRSLGLTIAAKLAQQIGGRFEEPAAGSSTFRLDFPLGATDKRFDKPGEA